MTTKEFKVDKLGFYRTRSGQIAIILEWCEKHDIEECWRGWVENGGETIWWRDDGGMSDWPNNDYDLVELIAPFDVWKMAELLILAKEQRDIPPEFDKLFQENFWNLLA